MRMRLAIPGLLLIALGWLNATASDHHPALLLIGFALLLTAGAWPARELRVAAWVMSVPLAYWLYMEGFYQGPICSVSRGCVESWRLPQVVKTALELVPYVVVATLASRLRRHRSQPRRRTVVPPAKAAVRL